ncbi:MAG: PQQ-dependent sugar dehydrogenase [Brevefilum sp.]|nr:PQQ-dependent sugar dehydrogenase [Brevefilum sp.]
MMTIKAQSTNRPWVWILILLGALALVGMTLFALAASRRPAFAQDNIDMPDISLTQVAADLARPVHVTHAGDGSGRLFIVEQHGRITILDGEPNAAPFLDIADRVQSPLTGGGNEEGLLSVAFPPGFEHKGHFYVYYTMRDGDNVLSRFSLTEDPNQADPASEEQILVLPHPQYSNHNGGQLAFGPDGYLYIGTGDGGGGGDPLGNAQDPSTLNGKLLRIDVEMVFTTQDPLGWFDPFNERTNCKLRKFYDQAYAIPEDNPFIDNPAYRPEIWAIGLRNPWRFSFDRESGDLFIADVGQNRWEEINYQPASSPGGQNYGWNIMEGEECYGPGSCETEELTLPVFVYPIFSASDCSITGGHVYRGAAIPDLNGVYIYGDFCSGSIWGLTQAGNEWLSGRLASTNFRISAFGEDEEGEVYVADMVGGSIYKITVPNVD